MADRIEAPEVPDFATIADSVSLLRFGSYGITQVTRRPG